MLLSLRKRSPIACLALAALFVGGADSGAENVSSSELQPTQQINHFINQGWTQDGIEPAEGCSDRTFVRRVYLDLAGRVPTNTEVDTFLADEGDDKRQSLVDLLLHSEDYVQHFADVFDALLMGRADENKYAQRSKHHWRSYLENIFRLNRPWNDVAQEILLARPDDPSQRGADWFLYERNNQHQAIAEAVAPAVFGIRIECAQCHDHMIADEIEQAHYWGLVAFFNRSKNVNTKNGPRVSESAIGGFSEFANLSGESSPNVLTFFRAAEIDEPRPGKEEQQDADDLYVPARVEGDPRVPKFSRRQKFVDQIVNDHPLVARALVNRVWAMLMGRGIVHPFDEMDSVHDPSHPELLDWLSDDFAEHGFDVRRLARSVVLSDAYQLESIRPLGVDDPATFAWYLERPLTAEQLARSMQLVVRGSFQNDDALVRAFRQQFLDVLPDENRVTINDALFLSNGSEFDNFLKSSNDEDHLIPRLLQFSSAKRQATLLITTALGREPAQDEVQAMAEYLEKRSGERQNALRQVVWALLTSAEFRFNH
jgi:hypothetical protein